MLIRFILILGLTLLSSSTAWSIMEVRLTYSSLLSKPEIDKIYNGTTKEPPPTPAHGIGTDILMDFESGLGVGMRYENLSGKSKGRGLQFESEMTRTALLLNWRFINTQTYFGPVLSFGFSHSSERIIVTENAVVISDLTADKPQSYSAGLEIGTKLGGFRLGTEAGYMVYQWEDLSGYEGSIKAVDRLDMSGPYVKAIIGFGI